MNEVYILAGALVASGLYITYQYSVIAKYRRMLALSVYALEAAYDHIVGEKDEEADTE